MDKRPHDAGSIGPDAELPLPDKAEKTGVRRVNNVPLLIIGGVLAVFVLLVAMVAAQRGQNAEPEPRPGSLGENSQALDQMLAHGALGGLVADPDEGQVPSFGVARVANPDLPPAPPSQGEPAKDPDEMAKRRMELFRTAMAAKTALSNANASPRPSGTGGGDGAAGDSAEKSGGPQEIDKRIPVAAGGDYGRYDRKPSRGAKTDRWLLGSGVETPRTAYEVRAGSVIPATMISGINSDLPGQIIAQVSQDVFDTPTGRHRLIPQGSKLVGRYDHQVVMGQSRVLVAWQRITFPDGKVIDIGAMEGVDSAGYAGFRDQVDRHYLRLFGSAILMSGIVSGLTSSRVGPNNDPFGSSNAALLSQNLAQQIGEVATRMIERNMDIAPTLQIRPGYRFNVMAVKDLTFEKPYQPFDY